MKKLFILIFLFVVINSSYAAPEVQISSERDAKGKFVNEQILAVDWEMETDGITYKEYQAADVPDHHSTDDDRLQEWYAPKPKAGHIYWKFTFTRAIKGEYAIRWRSEPEAIWSEWVSCTIEQTRPPKQGG